MVRIEESYWLCRNRACGLTVLSTRTERDLESRRCACGSLMEKHVQPTVFSYLDFLGEEAANEAQEVTGKEQ
jgi:hypothetical protein